MATAAQWIEGARLRTLPLAVAPIIAGSAAAYEINAFKPLYAFLAFLVAFFLQVGVNYANDYSDGIKGTAHGHGSPGLGGTARGRGQDCRDHVDAETRVATEGQGGNILAEAQLRRVEHGLGLVAQHRQAAQGGGHDERPLIDGRANHAQRPQEDP